MGFDAFIDFLLTFFPLKQMERMKNAVSTHTADSKKDLDNIQDAFRELLPWLGANCWEKKVAKLGSVVKY